MKQNGIHWDLHPEMMYFELFSLEGMLIITVSVDLITDDLKAIRLEKLPQIPNLHNTFSEGNERKRRTKINIM